MGFASGDPVNLSDPFGLCPPCTVSDDGANFIAGFEGYVATPYRDVAGHLTIGYGHRILSGEKFDHPLTKAAALALLKEDINDRVQSGLDQVKPDLSQNEVDALGSFIFNVGTGAFGRSTLLKQLNAGKKKTVPGQLKRWTRAGGKVQSALVRRRNAEARLWTTGDYGTKPEDKR